MSIFANVNQCPPTKCPATLTPGPPGRDGKDGQDGAAGLNAFTTTTATFAVPTSGGTAVVAVANSSWVGVGSIIFISNAGYWTVVTVLSEFSIRVSPLASNPVAGTNVPLGASVALAGPVGPAGANGSLVGAAGGDLTGNYPNPTLQVVSGLTPGSYPKVTVDAKGRVVSGGPLAGGDVPPMTGDTGAGGVGGGVPAPPAGSGARGAVLRATGEWGQTIRFVSPIHTSSQTLTHDDELVLFNAASAPVTAFLPPANTLERGSFVTVKKVDTSTNPVTISPNGVELIDGREDYTLSIPYSSVTFVCSGTGWVIVGETLPIAPRFFVAFAPAAYPASATTLLGGAGGNAILWNDSSAYNDLMVSRFDPRMRGKYLVTASVEGEVETGVPVSLVLYRSGVALRRLGHHIAGGSTSENVVISGTTLVTAAGSGEYFDVRVVVGAGGTGNPTLTGTFGADRISG